MINKDITNLLNKEDSGFSLSQQEDISDVYQRLKEIARGQRFKISGSGINTTALVNEAWIKSKKQSKAFTDRNHFFAYCAIAMRHILLNEAKRNQILTFVEYENNQFYDSTNTESDYLIELDAHLKNLKKFNPRIEQVFTYKYFGDMEFFDIAELLKVSERTVFRDWQKAKTMLAAAMQ
jgi:RNA polymerase sigma factor (TIGR02999 family)